MTDAENRVAAQKAEKILLLHMMFNDDTELFC